MVDSDLYLSTSVHLHDTDGTQIGETNFIFYGGNREGTVSIRGSPRFYFDGPWAGTRSCQTWPGTDLSDLGGFNFVMTISVGSPDMFQFEGRTGERVTVDMGSCGTYSEWREVVGKAVSAEISLYAWQEDLEEYFTTQFTVV